MKVKPRELQMRQLTNVRQKDKRKGGLKEGWPLLCAIFLLIHAPHPSVLQLSRTHVGDEQVQGFSRYLMSGQASVAREDFVIIFYFSPLKFFYMRVCGLRSTQITTFRTNNRDPQRNTPKKSLFMFFLLFLISRHLALTPHFNVRLISAYPRVSLASAPTYPANSERMLCPSDYEVATTI